MVNLMPVLAMISQGQGDHSGSLRWAGNASIQINDYKTQSTAGFWGLGFRGFGFGFGETPNPTQNP